MKKKEKKNCIIFNSSLVAITLLPPDLDSGEDTDKFQILLSFRSLSERFIFLENSREILEVEQVTPYLELENFSGNRYLFDRKRGRRFVNISENVANIKLSINQFYKFQYHARINVEEKELKNYKEILKSIFLKCNFISGILGSDWCYPRKNMYFILKNDLWDDVV